MRKTVVILDFSRTSASAGVFSEGRSLESVEYFSIPADGDARNSVARIMDELRSKGIKDFSRVIAGIPADLVSLRIIELPFSDKKKLEEVLPFEARDVFLNNVGELILCSIPLTDGKVLAAAVEKTTMAEWLGALKESGADPFWITSSLFSRQMILKKLGDHGVSAFVDADSVAVVKDGRPRFFKAISGAGDLSFALRALAEEGVNIEKFYSTPEASELLKTLGVEAAVLNEYSAGKAGLLALAAHLNEGALNEAVNFRIKEFADDKDIRSAEKGYKMTAVLLGALVVLWGGYSYIRYSAASASIVRSERKLESVYRDLFPGETKVVDAPLQMDAKLKGLRDEEAVLKGSIHPDEVMAELSEAATARGAAAGAARIYSLHLEAGRLVANGYAGSFEGANYFRDSVSRLPYFKGITLTDVKARAEGGASFSLSASIPERP